MITSEQKKIFEDCCSSALVGTHEQRGIGTLGERTLHVILKHFFEPDTAFHEQKIGRYVADICTGDEIIEIQTRAFGNLRGKLQAFTPLCKVNVVYPIANVKQITWLDPDSGELSERRKSPKHGKPWDFLFELYALRPIMPLSNVTFTLVFCNIEEFRLKNGYGSDKKRGSQRYERIPTELCDIIVLSEPRDYLRLIPEVSDNFTVADFAKAAKMTRGTAGKAVRTLESLNVIEMVGKCGKAFVYQRIKF